MICTLKKLKMAEMCYSNCNLHCLWASHFRGRLKSVGAFFVPLPFLLCDLILRIGIFCERESPPSICSVMRFNYKCLRQTKTVFAFCHR